jgi:hypothetical protein
MPLPSLPLFARASREARSRPCRPWRTGRRWPAQSHPGLAPKDLSEKRSASRLEAERRSQARRASSIAAASLHGAHGPPHRRKRCRGLARRCASAGHSPLAVKQGHCQRPSAAIGRRRRCPRIARGVPAPRQAARRPGCAPRRRARAERLRPVGRPWAAPGRGSARRRWWQWRPGDTAVRAPGLGRAFIVRDGTHPGCDEAYALRVAPAHLLVRLERNDVKSHLRVAGLGERSAPECLTREWDDRGEPGARLGYPPL